MILRRVGAKEERIKSVVEGENRSRHDNGTPIMMCCQCKKIRERKDHASK